MNTMNTEEKLEIIHNAIIDRKAEDIEVIDLTEKSIMTDYFVLASGSSNVHIRAIVESVREKMKARKILAERVEGYSEARWVLLDYGDVVVHIFAPDEREYYDLESLWSATEERRS